MGTITFQFLRDVQKREKNTVTLQEVPESFYKDVAKYLSKKQKNPREYENVLPVVKFILDRREQKIINSAVRYSRSVNMKRPKNMLKEEEVLFDKLVEVIKIYRIDINSFKTMLVNENNMYLVKEDIPEFVGVDMNTYGPWNKGDVVELKDDVAEVLVSAGKLELKGD